MSIHRRGSIAASLALGMLFGACAQQVGDIDRTQPNRIEKTAFEGEWYFLQTVVDTNATAVSTFAGLQGSLERVRFDIREDFLVARRTYEDIVGSDTTNFGVAEGIDFTGGAPVAAWPVMMHFDVQRQYNPATGEQQNVIVENMFDRPWFERQWMRVNFGWNVVDSGVNPMMGTQWRSNVSYIPNDQGPFTSWFVERDDEGRVVYIDVVNEYVIQPDWVDCVLTVGIPNWGSECGPERIKVRSSFSRIMEESDHIPRVLDDFDMREFGFFRTHRCVMDRRFGCRDNTRVTLANTWNIWERNRRADGTELPFAERTPKPIVYYSNPEMPIDLLDESWEIAEEWSYAFRRAVAGAQGRPSIDDVPRMFYFCLNPGSTDPTVPQAFLDFAVDDEERDRLRATFAASAEGYQLGHCVRPGEVKNIGDVRFSFMNWVNNHPSAPWLGYGPSAADPLSAQIIHGAANVNGQSVDTYSQYALDLARVINGELTPADLGFGEQLAPYFAELRRRNQDRLYFGYETATHDYANPVNRTQGQALNLDDQVASLTTIRTPMLRTLPQDVIESVSRRNQVRETVASYLDHPRLRDVAERMRVSPGEFRMRDHFQRDPFRAIRGTQIEQRMITEEMRVGFGQIFENGPEAMSEEQVLDFVSPARWNTAGGLARRMRERYRQNLARTIEMAADFDPYLLGFATEIAALQSQLEATGMASFDVQERLWRFIRGRIYRAVQEHEVGHTVGLRHNFEASRDALNYHPQYWALRQRTFDENCNDIGGFQTFRYDGLSSGDVAPTLCGVTETAEQRAERSAQLLTEIRNGVVRPGVQYGSIHQYQYASIMDYDGKPSTHFAGLGLYDYAAIAFGYTDLVEVFVQAPWRLQVDAAFNTANSYSGTSFTRATSRVSDMRDVDLYNLSYRDTGERFVDDEQFSPISNVGTPIDNRWTDYHYSVLPIMFHDRSAAVPSGTVASSYHPLIDMSEVGSMGNMYNRRLVPRAEAARSGAVRVPYRFCSDEYESTSNVCKVFDLGADDLEVMDNIRRTYENYYVVDYFRRGRAAYGLWLWPIYGRTVSRYFGPAIQLYQYLVLDLFRGQNYYAESRAGLDRLNAAFDAVNFVSEALTNPTVGTYVLDPDLNQWIHITDDEGFRYSRYDRTFPNLPESSYIDVGVADGGRYGASRFVRNEDRELNYYSWLQFETISHFIAKLAALETLTSGRVEVLGADTISDNSAFWLPPYVLFADELNRFMGGLINENLSEIGWCMQPGQTRPEAIVPIRSNLTNSLPPCVTDGGTLLNPYRAGFGRRDFNIQIQAAVYAAAFFQATLDKSWMDASGVYMWQRGEMPAIFDAENNPNFRYELYEDTTGITYAAVVPANWDASDFSPANAFPGGRMILRLREIQREVNTACPFQFGGARDLLTNCGMTEAEAKDFRCGYWYTEDRDEYRAQDCTGWDDESSAAHIELNGRVLPFFDRRNRLESMVETVRFHMEVSMVYNNL
jgi:hypothetical protein